MIGYIEGTLVATLPDSVVIHTTGGVGYQVYLHAPLLARSNNERGPASYYIATVVRDNEISLYGFAEIAGKNLFEMLLKASGVGPKLALSLLSAFSVGELADAVATDDVALLGSIPGIGKKTATRLCLDLKDRMAAWGGAEARPAAGRELASALTNLGFPEKEVYTAIRQIPPGEGAFSDQLKQALKILSNP